MKEILKDFKDIYLFKCMKEDNRDGLDIWKIQAGLCFMMWLFTFDLILTLLIPILSCIE